MADSTDDIDGTNTIAKSAPELLSFSGSFTSSILGHNDTTHKTSALAIQAGAQQARPVDAKQNPSEDCTAVQPFRLLALPPELWITICKMVVDNSPGVSSPPSAVIVGVYGKGLETYVSPWENYDQFSGSLRDEQKLFLSYLPKNPAITQTSRDIRRESLAYFYQTKVHVTFDWRNFASYEVFEKWVSLTDPKLRHQIQKLDITGLAKYDADVAVAVFGDSAMFDWMQMSELKSELRAAIPDHLKRETYTDLLRYKVGVDFRTVDKSEHKSTPRIREYKERIVFDRSS